MEGLNARDPISGPEYECQLTLPMYRRSRKAYIWRIMGPLLVIVMPLVMEAVFSTVHVVVMVGPHVLAAVSRTGGSQ